MNVGTKFLSIPDMEEPRRPGQTLEREAYCAVCPLVREAYFVVWGMKTLRAVPEIWNPAKSPSPVPENFLSHCSLTPYTHINTTALSPQNKLRQTTLALPEAMLFLLIRGSCFSHVSIKLYNSYLKFLPQLYSHF